MAEAPTPSGYDEDFVNAVEDENLCLICHLVLKKPVQTRCGHKFCKECLEEHFRRQEAKNQPLTCPADREGLDRDRKVFPDKAAERKILSLAIKCPSEGCAWTGELPSKETHLASCPLRDVPCTNGNCQVTLKRKDLSEHLSVTCQWRIVPCEHCSEPHPKCQMEDLEGHFKTCERFPVSCPNKCEALIFRDMVSNHIEDDCPLTKIPCPYACMGCRTEVQRDELESHINCATRSHLDLACGELRDTQEKYKQLEQKVKTCQTKLEQKISMERKMLLVCFVLGLAFLAYYLRKIEDLEDSFQTKLEEKASVIQGLHKKNVILQMSPEASHIFVWRITCFETKLMEAKNNWHRFIESVTFYAYGYKLMLGLYPNGYDDGENTHLSIVFFVMNGKYDAILPWGFSKPVTFTLMDQQNNPDQRQDVVMGFTADPNEIASANMGGKYRQWWSFTQFVSHSDLRTRRFLVEDTLFIKVKVDSAKAKTSWL